MLQHEAEPDEAPDIIPRLPEAASRNHDHAKHLRGSTQNCSLVSLGVQLTRRLEMAQSGMTVEQLRARRGGIVQIVAAHDATNVRVFGSVARGEADAESDVDLLVDVIIEANGFAYFGLLEDLRRELAQVLEREVDIVDGAGLRRMKERVLDEAIPI
jgi:predicted nucleotidyltransferase